MPRHAVALIQALFPIKGGQEHGKYDAYVTGPLMVPVGGGMGGMQGHGGMGSPSLGGGMGTGMPGIPGGMPGIPSSTGQGVTHDRPAISCTVCITKPAY